ncbi:platelet-activating factor acetylhydrolase 2, cytoplasmic-like [Exaiptasia diaphana]|uniref:1-alkyl-2-acetylglycerophosphocholine esterase n=1 Tax=Exaiptasia diaphana TaxID=2652724 RepID=A0A913X8P5_EXADI|nr:platelet-activating factor acetylhydrolase 2, cytoplasmic-like [Exaiptasia diaphana]
MSGWFSRTSKTLPDCTGPFSVGCADIMFAQSESLKFGSFIRLFYPTSPKSSDSASNPKQALWCPRKEYSNGLASFINMSSWLFGKLIHWTVGNVVIPAIPNAPLISGQDDSQGMPCIVFSHGLGGNRFMYSTYCCELASHGCLVAMVEHRYSRYNLDFNLD